MNKNHIRIGITGKARAGKDTVFSLLAEELMVLTHKVDQDMSFKGFAFGDDLKLFAEALFPEKFSGEKPRELFQDFGQSMRSFNPDVWVNKVDSKVRSHGTLDGTPVSFITDIRQPNEFKYCQDNFFYTIKVSAPLEIRLARMEAEGDSFSLKSLDHETELHIDTYDTDYTVHNQFNDHESLRFKVNQIAKDILKREGVLVNDKQQLI